MTEKDFIKIKMKIKNGMKDGVIKELNFRKEFIFGYEIENENKVNIMFICAGY